MQGDINLMTYNNKPAFVAKQNISRFGYGWHKVRFYISSGPHSLSSITSIYFVGKQTIYYSVEGKH